MQRMLIGISICLWAVAAWPHDAQAQRRGLQPEDYYREIGVSQTAISPAGDLTAFTVMTIDEDESTRHREIWLQPLRGAGPTASRSASRIQRRNRRHPGGRRTAGYCRSSPAAATTRTRPGSLG